MGMDVGASYSISSGILSSDYSKLNNSSSGVYKTQTYQDILLKTTYLKAPYKTQSYQF